jgi:hypothetical protein
MDAEITGPDQQDELDVKGQIHFLMTDADGSVVMDETVDNAFTTAGKNALVDQFLASPTLNKPTHMALGSGSPAANALGSQLGTRNTITKSRSGNVLTMVGSFAPGEATGAVTEAGVFDAATSGNMFNSGTFSVINKSATMTLEITWTLTIN